MKIDLIEKYKIELEELFSAGDYRKAHDGAKEVLAAMVRDNRVLFEAISKSIQVPSFLASKRINPVLAIPMIETKDFTLVANCWIPRPDGDTEISHQSIHHHGNLILTSASAYGDGYESILFKKLPKGDLRSENISLDKIYSNPRGKIEFIDSYTPHVVFYPATVSVTFALWSREERLKTQGLVKSSLLKKYRKPIKAIIHTFKVGGLFGLNQVDQLDYSVRNGEIYSLNERVMYKPGSNENFLQALQFFLNEIKYDRADDLKKIAHAQGQVKKDNEFEPHQLNVPDVNIPKQEILRCLDQ